jgi:1-acyl-sn-glycerol-3-phosphate acyltransferase
LVISGVVKSAAILFLTVISALGSAVAGLLTREDRIPSGIMRWWGRGFIRIGGWKVRVEGLGNLPPGGAILAANHQSLVDIPLFLTAIPREVRFLAKRELGRIPLFGYAMVAAGNLFIDREDPRDAVHLVREATERMGHEALPRGALLFRPAALAVRILPPMAAGGERTLTRDELAEETRKRILSARGGEEDRCSGAALV